MTEFKWTYGDENIEDVMKIRKDVFCTEQGIKEEYEYDEFDKEAYHLLMLEDGKAVATGRFLLEENNVHFGRIAVIKEERKNGYGKKIVEEMIRKAKETDKEKITIVAQSHAVPFYEKSGFATCSIEYLEAEVKSIDMQYDLIFPSESFYGFEDETEAAIVRKTFDVKNIKEAKVKIASFGFCEPYFNGKKLTEEKFIPAWTNYEYRDFSDAIYPIYDKMTHRAFYLEYDLTDLINDGKNVFALHIGNGWYNQHKQVVENVGHYGKLKFAVKFIFTDVDGNTKIIVSDGTEKYQDSFIKETNIYLNETVDAREFDEKVFLPDYDDSSWKNVNKKEKPLTIFEKQFFSGDKIKYSLTPTLLFEKYGKKMYDIGKNVSGLPILKFEDSAAIGDEMHVSYSEILNEDGTQSLRSTGGDWRKQCDKYINGKNNCPLTTTFTWRAGRYVEVDGKGELIRFDVTNSDVPVSAEFSSNNETLNWFFNAYVNTQSNNIHTFVPSDCPHRERLGYTGDGQLCSAAVMTIFDAEPLYTKWMQDIADSQDIYNGHVQHTAPFYGGGGGPGGWGGAIGIVPYNMYKFYGDKKVLSKYYPAIISYISYMEEHSDNGIVVREEEKGWCLGDWCTPNNDIKIPEKFVNTYFLIKVISNALEIAEILGYEDDISALEEKLIYTQNAFTNAFFDEDTGSFLEGVQGADAFAVDIGLGDERTLQNLVKKYTEKPTYDTGIFGTDILTRVLFKNGFAELAFKLLTNEEETSFYNMKKSGATTLWENWDGIDSHSHPMFGAVAEYLFKYILGIEQTEDSCGYEKVSINPAKIDGLNVRGSILTKRGRISVEVKYTDGIRSVKFSLPESVELV